MLSRLLMFAFLLLAAIPGIYAGGLAFVLLAHWFSSPLWLLTAPLFVSGGLWASTLVSVAILVQLSIWLGGPDLAVREVGAAANPVGIISGSLKWVVVQVLQLNGVALPPNSSLKRTDQSLRD